MSHETEPEHPRLQATEIRNPDGEDLVIRMVR